jgi:hypothetical protein
MRLLRLFVDSQDHVMNEGGQIDCDTLVTELGLGGLGAVTTPNEALI